MTTSEFRLLHVPFFFLFLPFSFLIEPGAYCVLAFVGFYRRGAVDGAALFGSFLCPTERGPSMHDTKECSPRKLRYSSLFTHICQGRCTGFDFVRSS